MGIFDRVKKIWSQDMAIDLGTANTLVVLKEKLLAARRGGIKTVLIPQGNVRDLKEIPDNIKDELEIKPVKWIDEVLNLVLTSQPVQWEKEEEIPEKVSSKKKETSKKSIGTH